MFVIYAHKSPGFWYCFHGINSRIRSFYFVVVDKNSSTQYIPSSQRFGSLMCIMKTREFIRYVNWSNLRDSDLGSGSATKNCEFLQVSQITLMLWEPLQNDLCSEYLDNKSLEVQAGERGTSGFEEVRGWIEVGLLLSQCFYLWKCMTIYRPWLWLEIHWWWS